jgi:hypothetical protein
MVKTEIADLEAARAKLVDLLIGCPLEDNPPDCPLSGKRGLPFAERVAWVQTLAEAELLKIYAAHCRCMKAKLS